MDIYILHWHGIQSFQTSIFNFVAFKSIIHQLFKAFPEAVGMLKEYLLK